MTRQREGETITVYDTAKEQIDDSIYEPPDHVELPWRWINRQFRGRSK